MVLVRPSFKPQFRRKRAFTPRASGAARLSAGKLSGETKYVDGYLDITTPKLIDPTADGDWTGTEKNPKQQTAIYGCLPVPRQGQNYADRDGRKIFQKNIRIRGEILWRAVDSEAVPAALGLVRIVIVKDTRTNKVELSGENVIGAGLGSDGLATLSGNGNGLQLMSNPDGWGRYQIVKDKTFRCPPLPAWGDATNLGNSSSMKTPFSFSVKCNCEVNFEGSLGAIGAVLDNSFHVLIAASDTSEDARVSYYARTSFVG